MHRTGSRRARGTGRSCWRRARVIVALVVVTLRTSAPFWKMSYCWMVQLAPGDAAFHDSVTVLLVLAGEPSPVGMLGSMLQLPAGAVVTDSAPLWAEALPALSRARTRKVNAVFAARPLAVKLVPVGEPTIEPFWNTSYPATPLPPALSV